MHIFFRDRYFYPVEGIKDDKEVLVHVALNPGTTRVETIDGRVVYDDKVTPAPESATQ